MSKAFSKLDAKAKAVVNGDAVIPSKVPVALKFPLVVILSLTLSSLLYSITASFTAGDLASVSRRLDSWWDIGILMGFRAFELGLGWFGGYDGYDLAALGLLSHAPPLYLLSSFYNLRPLTLISSLVIDSLATYIPLRLLRPLSLAHAASSSSRSVMVPNRDIVTDLTVQAYATILASLIYAVTLFTAYSTYLPFYLATYFENLPSIAVVYSATPITLLPSTLALGLAAKSFIFTPAVATVPSSAKKTPFNPETATLEETFWHNFWGFNLRTKAVIKRTATLMLISGANTFVQTFVTIEGVEAPGAFAYSGIWVVAACVTGASLGLVGAV